MGLIFDLMLLGAIGYLVSCALEIYGVYYTTHKNLDFKYGPARRDRERRRKKLEEELRKRPPAPVKKRMKAVEKELRANQRRLERKEHNEDWRRRLGLPPKND